MYFDEPSGQIVAADDKVLPYVGGAMALAVSPLGYFAIPVLSVITAQAAKALF